MKERFVKWLKYVPVFVLMLFSFSFDVQADASASGFFNVQQSTCTVPVSYGTFGADNVRQISFSGTISASQINSDYNFLFICNPTVSIIGLSETMPTGTINSLTYYGWLDNLKITVKGKTFDATYNTWSGYPFAVFEGDFSYTAYDIYYTITADVHIVPYSSTGYFGGYNNISITGTKTSSGAQIPSGSYSDSGSIVLNTSPESQQACKINGFTATLGYSSSYVSGINSNQAVFDSVANENAKKALEESQKQTSALTEFSRKDEMSSNASSNGSIMGDYSESEDAVVSGAHDGLSKFDFLAPLKFAAGLSQSVLLCSTWLSDLIGAMGDFSFIFTLGSALTIVICIFVGLSRFKRGG